MKAYKFISVHPVYAQIDFKCLVCLVKEKNKYKNLLASLKILGFNSNNGFESHIKFLFSLSFGLIGRFLQCKFMAGFPNKFQDCRRLS